MPATKVHVSCYAPYHHRPDHHSPAISPGNGERMAFTLDGILNLLNRYHQRATYGAVAGVLRKVPQSVLQGRKKDRRHSWVVNQRTGLPTGYHEFMIHPALTERPSVFETENELRIWLDDPS